MHTEPGPLVLVNVWDVASAGAVATAHGYPVGERIPVDLMLAAVDRIAAAVDLPSTADLGSGYGDVDTTI